MRNSRKSARGRIWRGELLPQELLQTDPACMFVWLKLPRPWRADDFAANAKARGVVVMPSSAFAVDRSEIEHGVRITLHARAAASNWSADYGFWRVR